MINAEAKDRIQKDGQLFVKPQPGLLGHVIYGPYDSLEPGFYRVEFSIVPTRQHADGRDPLCAFVDVTSGPQRRIAEGLVFASLLDSRGRFTVDFEVLEPLRDVEYRVFANGVEPLLVADAPSVQRVGALGAAPCRELPAFFKEHLGKLIELFHGGLGLSVLGDDVVATACGFSFYARVLDDLNFVNEVIFRNTYNLIPPSTACLIDIGMNIGLTSLRLATMDKMREIHAFEPFPSTFARASANLALNPHLKDKVRMNNFGLFDTNRDVVSQVASSDSGSYSVFGAGQGEQVRINLREAGGTLGPILQAARKNGSYNIIKMDCEGSEYSVFRSLISANLIPLIDAFMVEYHRGSGQSRDLINPLNEAGFSVIDLGYSGSNGFFYAVRAA